MELEEMGAFFTARADSYDAHMLDNVEGCREAYQKLAALLPKPCDTLLDLGCGTGLELKTIFARFPAVAVTGIDLAQAMLDKLSAHYPDKTLHLICGDYRTAPFGEQCYDCAVSFQTMHHFPHEEKTAVYQKIRRALKPGGIYVECDYMVTDLAEETAYYAQRAQLPNDTLYHFDTPCTIKTQRRLLQEAGFGQVEQHFRKGNTTILIAYSE